jgi:GDPmannose 4,6-dehydratase
LNYRAELLLEKGYGIVRRIVIEDTEHKLCNVSHLLDRSRLHVASLDNVLSLIKTIKDVVTDACYHLAASSFVSYSFEDEISILNNNVNNTHYLLASKGAVSRRSLPADALLHLPPPVCR